MFIYTEPLKYILPGYALMVTKRFGDSKSVCAMESGRLNTDPGLGTIAH